jgi:hypothetical protein
MIRRLCAYVAISVLAGACCAGVGTGFTGRGIAGDPLGYDFGCVGIDFNVYYVYHLINHGNTAVHIKSIDASCDCSSVQCADSVIAPGDTVDCRLQFNTKDYYGKMSRHITVNSDDQREPELKMYFFATVGQWMYRVKPEPSSLFFLPGQKTKTVTLSNPDIDNLTLREIDCTDDIVVVEPVTKTADKGESIQLKVTPKPDLVAGTYQTNFRVCLDIPGAEQSLFLTIPVKIVRY